MMVTEAVYSVETITSNKIAQSSSTENGIDDICFHRLRGKRVEEEVLLATRLMRKPNP